MQQRLWSILVLLISMAGVACQESPTETSSKEFKVSEREATHEAHEEVPIGKARIRLPSEALQEQAFQSSLVVSRVILPEIRVTATIQPNEYKMAQISPRIEGQAVKVFAELGDRAEAGQTLALLDSMDLGTKKAAFLQARVNLKVAKRNFERERRLYAQRITSEKDYLEAKGEFERSVAAYQASREALRIVGVPEEEIKTMRWDSEDHPLSHFHLTAPFPGTIVSRDITLGEVIKPFDVPFTITDLNTVWVLLDIFEKDLASVLVGSEVLIQVDAYPNDIFRGTITYLSNVLDPDTRVARARVEIANRDGRLRPGMFATARITVPSTDKKRTALVIPQDAIQRVDETSLVFVEESPGNYLVREVTLGTKTGLYVEVSAGVTEGERVVTQGSFYLKATLVADKLGGHPH